MDFGIVTLALLFPISCRVNTYDVTTPSTLTLILSPSAALVPANETSTIVPLLASSTLILPSTFSGTLGATGALGAFVSTTISCVSVLVRLRGSVIVTVNVWLP